MWSTEPEVEEAIALLRTSVASLPEGRGASVQGIAREHGIALAVANRAVDQLVFEGLVVRAQCRIVLAGALTKQQQAAHVHVARVAQLLRVQGAKRFPTLRELARGAGVATGTLGAVIRRLSDSGVVTSRNRQGIRLTGTFPVKPRAGARAPHYAWERFHRTLTFAILSGVYRKGAFLPGIKELSARYGVSYRTAVKALGEMTERKLIERSGRRFLVPASHTGRGKAIVLVARGTPDDRFFVLSSRTVETLRIFEHHCACAGIEPIIAVVNDKGIRLRQPCARYTSLSEAMERTAVIGFVLWTMGLEVYDPAGLIRYLSTRGKPVAVFDEEGSIALPRQSVGLAPVQSFSLGSSMEAGMQAARHLLGLGHRRVAFVSLDHHQTYSINRLAGLQREYADAGLPGAVSVSIRSGCSAPEKTDAKTRELFERLCHEGWMEIPAGMEIPAPARQITMWEQLREIRNLQFFRNALYPLVDGIIGQRHCTAIVGVNDRTAMETIYRINHKGVRVPQDVSVMGFDNNQIASTGNITSYDFNGTAALHLLLEFILNPGAAPFTRHPPRPVETGGLVVGRDSTAPVARRRASVSGGRSDQPP